MDEPNVLTADEASTGPRTSRPVAPSMSAGIELVEALFVRGEISIDEYHLLRDEHERRAPGET
jgi:hypothetical protein